MKAITQKILDLFQSDGGELYFGEQVTQLEHALQSAALAVQSNSSPALIVAALLHDVGHMLHNLGEDFVAKGRDDKHEDLGARFLKKYFPPEVTEPVRLHVPAKRYLCTVDEKYRGDLSEASEASLVLQGGPMNPEERAAFEKEASYRDAVELRRFDDMAKIPKLPVPGIDAYCDLIDALTIEN